MTLKSDTRTWFSYSGLEVLQMTSRKSWDYEMLFDSKSLWSNKFQKLWTCAFLFQIHSSQNFIVKKPVLPYLIQNNSNFLTGILLSFGIASAFWGAHALCSPLWEALVWQHNPKVHNWSDVLGRFSWQTQSGCIEEEGNEAHRFALKLGSGWWKLRWKWEEEGRVNTSQCRRKNPWTTKILKVPPYYRLPTNSAFLLYSKLSRQDPLLCYYFRYLAAL